MERKIFIIGLVLMLLFAIGVNVFAEGNGPGYGRGKMGQQVRQQRREQLAEELGLTDEEKAKLKDLRDKHREEMKNRREEMRQKQKKLRELIASGEVDSAEVGSLVNSISELQKEMLEARVEQARELKNILGEEKYRELSEKRQERMKKRMQNRRNGGRGRRGGRR